MRELFYDQSSILIAVFLLLMMAGAIEAGYRIGYRGRHRTSDAAREQVNTVQASLLGILALMLGFTFSIALDRYNNRSAAVVEEANAIGTAYLRAALLPEPARSDARTALREYAGVRVRAAHLALPYHSEREKLLQQAVQIQDRLWTHAVAASQKDRHPATTGLFVQALNDMFDAYGRRIAEIDRHVPEFVLLLLFSAFILAGGIIGYSAGLAAHRPAIATYLMLSLVVLLMFMVMDLDRPRNGLIQVSQQSLFELNDSLKAAAAMPPSR